MRPPERFPPDDPRGWLNRAKSNLAQARARVPGAYLEDLCFGAQQAAAEPASAASRRPGIGADGAIMCVRTMARRQGVQDVVMRGRSDANVRFGDLRNLLLSIGFEERTRGSHHLFSRSGVVERVNLQRDGSHAKPYQVRQVRRIMLKYGLAREE